VVAGGGGDVTVLLWPKGTIVRLPRGTTAGEVLGKQGEIQIMATGAPRLSPTLNCIVLILLIKMHTSLFCIPATTHVAINKSTCFHLKKNQGLH
jgi:hypothetical protein